jgi:hypothetical protein
MKDKSDDSLSDFCLLNVPESGRLSQFERLTLVGGLELEKSLQWLAKKFKSFSYDQRLNNVNVQDIKDAASYYSNLIPRNTPEVFFQGKNSDPQFTLTKIHVLKDGAIYDLAYPSLYNAQHVGFIEELTKFSENLTVHARIWKHEENARATIIALHGWTMGDQRINSLAFQAGYFYSKGYNVVLVELPFHGRRKPSAIGAEDLGVLFPSANVIRTNEAIGQVISDLRALHIWLRENNFNNIGCIGMSLGGYVSALWAGLDQLAFCIPIVPLVAMDEMAWEIISSSAEFSEYKQQGLNRELLTEIYAMHSPLNFKSQISKERCFIIAGIGDKIIPARQAKLLWQHWNRPEIHWVSGGHFAQFQQQSVFDKIESFFKKQGF